MQWLVAAVSGLTQAIVELVRSRPKEQAPPKPTPIRDEWEKSREERRAARRKSGDDGR